MIGAIRNIIDIRKAIVLAFVSICLSFAVITPSYADSEPKNKVCNIPEMREKYKENCYSCIVVKTLTETFMTACATAYPKSREAGNKLLAILAVLWLVVYALRNVSSFTSLEPGNTVNDLLVFFFKVFVAYAFINAGINVLIEYLVEPILIAGADYGMAIVDATTGYNTPPDPTLAYNGPELISTKTMNKLFGVNRAIDATVAENLVIGNALVCHANNAGAWIDTTLLGFFTLKIPNVWILICGAAIWAVGFMLTLSISYYILDISFKLGFALIILPVVISLWPFNVTSDKFPKTISIILKSAAIFAFLAITASYSIVLISEAMRDLDKFYDRIENDDATWISQTYDITGPYFILIMFAYLYSLKMIGGTINNYVNKFFPDAVFGNASPIHSKATQATDMAKRGAIGLAKPAGKIAGKMALAGASGVRSGAVGLVRAAKRGETGGTSLAGNSLKLAGQAMQFAGRNAAKVGNMKQNLANKIRGLGNKQLDKGFEKQNAFRLAAGDLTLKAMGKEKDQTAITKGANKFEQWGKKLEGTGMDVNQQYRDKLRNPAIKKTKQAAKWTAAKGKQAAVWTETKAKNVAYSVQDFAVDKYNIVADFTVDKANKIANAAKQTKIYKKSAQVANGAGKVALYTGNKLVNTYNSIDAGARNAYQITKRATLNTAYGIRDGVVNTSTKLYTEARDWTKDTKVYKAADKVAKKIAGGAVVVGSRLENAYNIAETKATNGYKYSERKLRTGYHDTKDFLTDNKVTNFAGNVRDHARYKYEETREAVGTGLNKVKDGAGELKRDVNSYLKRNIVHALNNIKEGVEDGANYVADKTVRPVAGFVGEKAHNLNKSIYNKYGEKYEIKYGRNRKLETEDKNTIASEDKNSKNNEESAPKNNDDIVDSIIENKSDTVPTPNNVTNDPSYDKEKSILDLSGGVTPGDLRDMQRFEQLQRQKLSIEAEYQARINNRKRHYEKVIEDIKKQIDVDESSRDRLNNELKLREAERDRIISDLDNEKNSKSKIVDQELVNLINKGKTGGLQ